MAKLSEKRREQLKIAQRNYREKKKIAGEKQIARWVKESDNLIMDNQKPITNNQKLITDNQIEIISNQLANIKTIISDYEKNIHPTSVRWDIAKKLLTELKQVIDTKE